MTQFVKRCSQAPRGFVWAVVGCLVIQVLVPGCAKASDADPAKEKSSSTRTYWTPQRMREQWVRVHAALKQAKAQQVARSIENLPEINYELLHLVDDRDYDAAVRFVNEKIDARNGLASKLNDVLKNTPDKYSDGEINAIFLEHLELLSFPGQPLAVSWKDAFDSADRYGSGWQTWGLSYIAETGDVDRASALIQFGADLNYKGEEPGGHYGPPLWDALYNGHLAVAKLLIAAGADVNLRSTLDDECPLEVALSKWNRSRFAASTSSEEWDDVVRLLIEHGADLSQCSEDKPNEPSPTSEAPSPAGSAKASSPNPLSGRTLDLGGEVTMELVFVPAGEFLMGPPDSEPRRREGEVPQHRVTISKPFYLGKYEVTQAQWQTVMETNPSFFKGGNLPVENVSCDDAQTFCKKLSAKTGRTIRLPTEAEWEYACRAGTTTPFSFGETISTSQGNFNGDYYMYGSGSKGEYRRQTTKVGRFSANRFGLYDMHGNVSEWCQDWYAPYSAEAQTDPVGPASGDSRVFRGGCWDDGPVRCRSASRGRVSPDARSMFKGFRVASGTQ